MSAYCFLETTLTEEDMFSKIVFVPKRVNAGQLVELRAACKYSYSLYNE